MAVQLAHELPLATSTKLYDHTDYWLPLYVDLGAARGSIVVHVPFITDKGLKRWIRAIIDAIARGAGVTIVLQQPNDWHRRGQPGVDAKEQLSMDRLAMLVGSLESYGVRVLLRKDIHAKFVLIDETILWEGSLNFLSHWATTEHLRRSVNRKEVREVKTRHDLNNIPDYDLQADGDDRLRKLVVSRRQELGLKQAEAAALTSMGQSDLCRLEQGNATLITKGFRKLLVALDLRIVLVPAHLSGPVESFIKKAMSPPKT